MLNRKYDKSAYILAYKEANSNTKKKVKRRINKYLSREDYTLTTLAEELESILEVKLNRKTVKILLEYFDFSEKDKNLQHSSRVKSGSISYKKKREIYCQKSVDKLLNNNGTEKQFRNEWVTFPYSYFKDTYNLSQHEVDAVREFWGIKKEKTKIVKTYLTAIDELTELGVTRDYLEKFFIEEMHSNKELDEYLSNILGWTLGEKRTKKLLKHYNLKKTKEQIKYMQGRKSRNELNESLTRLSKSGYTLKTLAKEYEDDWSLTKREILERINAPLSNEEPKFTDRWLGRHLDPLVNQVRKRIVSRSEMDFVQKLEMIIPNKEILTSVRTLISPYEVDVYIPELNVAIEFNGDYWHSDKFLIPSHEITAEEYHLKKRNLCKEKGVTLFYVWESDWNRNYIEVLLALQKTLVDNLEPDKILLKLKNGY